MGNHGTLFNKNHIVYVDNYYTGLEVVHFLVEIGTEIVGTLRKNRIGIPKKVFVSKRDDRGTYNIMRTADKKFTVTSWVDNGIVLLLSSIGTGVDTVVYIGIMQH